MSKIEHPILINIPSRIEGERCYLRLPQEGDGASFLEASNETQDMLARYFVLSQEALNPITAEIKVRRFIIDNCKRKRFTFFIMDKQDQFIGKVGVSTINWDVPNCHIGYWCRTSKQGKGYINDSVKQVLKWLFDEVKMRRVAAVMDEDNIASEKVAQKLGFKLEAEAQGLYPRFYGDGELPINKVYVRFNSNGL